MIKELDAQQQYRGHELSKNQQLLVIQYRVPGNLAINVALAAPFAETPDFSSLSV